jgi:predicted RND superfamily exporter protein
MQGKSKSGIVIPKNKQQAQIGLFVLKLGLFIVFRQYIKYNIWYLIPGVSVNWVNGYDYYFDIEIKFLFIGVAFRVVWRKNLKIF